MGSFLNEPAVWAGVHVPDNNFEVSVEINSAEAAEGGLAILLNPFYWLASDGMGSTFFTCGPLRKSARTDSIALKLKSVDGQVALYWSLDRQEWKAYREANTPVYDRHFIALYAKGHGKVTFRNFTYLGLD